MDGWILRAPRQAATARYDLLVVGGGIYGAMTALEAARRGLAVLLVERGDFGAATSANSLRIVHGGLRYLQSGDLARHRTSVAERRWLLAHFPELVRPLPCLMPLYSPPRGGALRRPAALRLALAADALLVRRYGRRDEGSLPPRRRLPEGGLIDAAETLRLAPGLPREGLRGGALWYDAAVPAAERLVIEALRWACRCGARALNYVEAEGLLVEDGRVAGLELRDRVSGDLLQVRARRLVNCAGPWCRELAARFDRDLPQLFQPALAFNLLLDRKPPAEAALAVAGPARSDGKGSRTCFLVPHRGRLLAGTCHLAREASPGGSQGRPSQPAPPAESEIQGFLDELNAALPALAVRRADVLRVDWGLLPAARPGAAEPSSRPIVHDHAANGGPRGLVSVSGVKLTTARAVAQQALEVLWGPRLAPYGAQARPAAGRPISCAAFLRLLDDDRAAALSQLRRLVRRESVVTLDDLWRRTGWVTDRAQAASLARRVAGLFEEQARPPAAGAAGIGGEINGGINCGINGGLAGRRGSHALR
jgi:glycerol-3-phosphate dehydrogenase